jgi:hypothetical protein
LSVPGLPDTILGIGPFRDLRLGTGLVLRHPAWPEDAVGRTMSDLSVALASGTGSPPHVSECWQRDLGRCHWDQLVRGMNARAGPSLHDEDAPHWQEADHLPTGLVAVV